MSVRAVSFGGSAAVAALLATTAFPATVLLDFESEAQRAQMPTRCNGRMEVGCAQTGAADGSWGFALKPSPWKQGMPEWPSVNLPVARTDWRGYDRMTIDVFSLGDLDADALNLYICAPTGRVQNGKCATLPFVEGGFARWTIRLREWPATCDPSALGRLHFFFTRPRGCELAVDNVTLYRPGERIPPPPPSYVAMNESVLKAKAARRLAQERVLHAPAFGAFEAECRTKGQDVSPFWLGEATSMEKILPRGVKAPRALDLGRGLAIRLARRERESVQLFVAPRTGDLRNVRVEAEGLRCGHGEFAASNVACRVLGYVQTVRPPPYKVAWSETPEVGWWPDPILDHLDRTDVKGQDVQGFWIRVTCPADQPAGSYRGHLRVSAETADGRTETVRVPFAVRVNGFSVPRRSPLPLAITFAPGPNVQHENEASLERASAIRRDPLSPVNQWRRQESAWGEFLADYYITMDNLYHRSDGSDGNVRFDVLSRLREEGRLGVFNLGYWDYPKSLDESAKASWRKGTLARLRACADRARELGILDRAYIYGCDEVATNHFANVRWAAETLKREFPGVPVSTTAYDHDFGVGSPLSTIDWFTPLTPKYDPQKAAAARREGRQVWWYICCGPHAPHANMFIECPAIEGRILMGAQTAKYRPDGFLYYQISIWNAERPISGTSAFTDWPARSWTSYNGDGSWTCCGPGGLPLATQRLENFRDGLEDYAYALELERRLASEPSAPWAAEARRLLSVPDSVVTSMTQFTDDPAAVYAWRDAMADLLERGR